MKGYGPTRKKLDALIRLEESGIDLSRDIGFARVFADTLDRIAASLAVAPEWMDPPAPTGPINVVVQNAGMKPPLKAILIAGEEVQVRVEEGYKTITIREGRRDYRAGERVLLGCHLTGWAKMATVTSVRFTTIECLTSAEVHDDGFNSILSALDGLRKFYPNLREDSPVTVIRWELA